MDRRDRAPDGARAHIGPMTKRCPICAAPAVRDHAPFCSRGCASRDLLRWLEEGYRLPGAPADPEMIDAAGAEGLDTRRDTD